MSSSNGSGPPLQKNVQAPKSNDAKVNGGIVAWLQVLGAFCLFFCSWYFSCHFITFTLVSTVPDLSCTNAGESSTHSASTKPTTRLSCWPNPTVLRRYHGLGLFKPFSSLSSESLLVQYSTRVTCGRSCLWAASSPSSVS